MFGQFLDPSDLELLQRALAARLAHLNVRPESPEAQMIASQIIELFQNGVTDEHELATRPIAMEIIRRQG
ncbi:hypothetical protein [Pararhizobium sp. LjRoot238]|uniref:hypothetical protein n=1 Tax=Pararhizobium sp. LjRoot238 TaxID=3342293 RepID=UPI003ECFEC0B